LWGAIEQRVGRSEAARQIVMVLMLCRERGPHGLSGRPRPMSANQTNSIAKTHASMTRASREAHPHTVGAAIGQDQDQQQNPCGEGSCNESNRPESALDIRDQPAESQ
jgi:hypothetical protein